MKTFRLDPTVGDRSTAVVEEVDKLLREGKQVVVTVVASITQKQLGERLGVKEQQIQRWEANLYSGVGSEIVAAYPDLEAADVRAVISRNRPRRDRDRNFAVAGNFKRIDPDSRPVSEIPEDELMRGVGE